MWQLARLAMLCVLTVGLFGPQSRAEEPQKPDKAPPTGKKDDEGRDVSKTIAHWNSEAFAAPPTKFRAGHVKPLMLTADAIRKTDHGFEVKLPSGAPVATPTVYKGRVYVSGGFRSKEFYCFDARTGALVWGLALDDDGPSSAVVEDDVVVFNTESCTIFAVHAGTGRMLWSHWLGDPLTSTPTIAGGRVFTSYPAASSNPREAGASQRPPASHVLAALDLKTGRILWQRWIDSDVMTAPVATRDEIIASSFGGTVYRFKQQDGALISARKFRATSAPVMTRHGLFMTRRIDRLPTPAIGSGSGGAGGGFIAMESIAKVLGGAVVADGNKKRSAYIDREVQKASDLEEESKANDGANGFAGGAPAAANPHAAAGNVGQATVSSMQAFQGSRILHFADNNYSLMGDELVCNDPTTAKTTWRLALEGDLKKSGGFLGTSPVAAGGSLFIATLDGRLLEVDAQKGKVLRTFALGHPVRMQPAIHDGRAFIGTQDGRLLVIDLGDAKYRGWTTWGGNSQHTGVIESKASAHK